MILLTPGPCMTSETVRQAAAVEDMNHRDPTFLDLVRDTKRRLLNVYHREAEFVPYLIGGSGTAAVEAMVSSCLGNSRVLVLENGYYSARIPRLLAAHHIPFETLSHDWLAPLDLEAVRHSLADGQFNAVIATHNETTTGRLNPIKQLSEICREVEANLFVDAMSSFGVEDLEFEGIAGVCASANKCLHGLPGVSFVLLSIPMAEAARHLEPHTFYLHLPRYEGDEPPLTPPVPALNAFRQALREFDDQGGRRARKARYQGQTDRIRSAIAEAGLRAVLSPQDGSRALTTVSLPVGWTSAQWLDANREKGFLLYGCKGTLEERFFQVSNMGEVTDGQLEMWIAEGLSLSRTGP